MVDGFGGLYDIVLAFEGGKGVKPSVRELMNGKKYSAHVYIRRIPFNQVPQEQDQAIQFLYDMYARKVRESSNIVEHIIFYFSNF